MKLFSQIFFIARIEARYFVRFPRLLWATTIVALIPALYCVIYLSSVWDPGAHTGALAVGVVNLDEGVQYREHNFNIGQEVVTQLQASKRFGFQHMNDEAQARQNVRDGKLAFALIVPRGFSSNAIPGAQAGAGKLVVYTSEGNNFESAALARHFAETLGHDVNESLNERRWALVLSNATGSQRSVERLREGVHQLVLGARDLSAATTQTSTATHSFNNGTQQLSGHVEQLTSGVKQLGTGLRTLDAQRPPPSELRRLSAGAEALVSGHAEFAQGLEELQTGTQRLRDGVSTFRDEAKDSVFTPAKVNDSLEQFVGGITQLDMGVDTAINAHHKLTDGANRLSAGVETLTHGVRAMGTGLHTIVEQLPEERQLDALAKGANEVASGATTLSDTVKKINTGALQLTVGVELLEDSLPGVSPQMDGSAQGLATSVQPQVEIDAPVPNSGSGFAPNVIPAALWLGAGIAAFLIHVRVLPRHAQFFPWHAQLLGKIFLPAMVTLLQALLIFLTVQYVLHIRIRHPGAFALTLAVASFVFVLIVFALTRAFGDAGKAMAMIFLAVQLSSSGGVLPVELSGSLFMNISPWLPLTWVVRALKASMFGAYDGAWLHALLPVALAGLAAAVMASTVGRWRFVRSTDLRPAINF